MTMLHNFMTTLQNLIVAYAPDIIGAVLILILGWWTAKLSRTLLKRILEKKQVELTIRIFAGRILYVSILLFSMVAALAKLGIQTTSLIAFIGAIGLGVALALKNSLSDFAAGILLVVMRPFHVGDSIDSNGTSGTVQEINLLYTLLKTSDGKAMMVPNGKVMGSNITNFSLYTTRRTEIQIAISYQNDLSQAKAILKELARNDSRILSEPAPLISVSKLNDVTVQLLLRFWSSSGDQEAVTFALNEAIKQRFDEAKISMITPCQSLFDQP